MLIVRLFRCVSVECPQQGIEFVIPETRPLRLHNSRGRRLRCTAGCLWITMPGVADDIYLHATESVAIATDSLVLVEAVGAARALLED